jgi:hypothetical protein
MLAVVRPSDWEWPLFLHVLGAMLLVGTLLAAVLVEALAWRRPADSDTAGPSRLTFGILLLGVVPAFVLMRIGAEWIYTREGYDDLSNEPDWIDIGFSTADISGLILVVVLLVTGIAAFRARRGGGPTLGRIAAILATIVLLGYVLAIWAMTAKPG